MLIPARIHHEYLKKPLLEYLLPYLDHLNHQAEREGEGHDDDQHREDGQQVGADARPLLTNLKAKL